MVRPERMRVPPRRKTPDSAPRNMSRGEFVRRAAISLVAGMVWDVARLDARADVFQDIAHNAYLQAQVLADKFYPGRTP